MEHILGLKVHDDDNVATIFGDAAQGDTVEVRDKKGRQQEIATLGAIPYGHKLAVKPIAKGEIILKYGEEIGMATQDIATGAHVHVHNLDSMRGRGDLPDGGKAEK